MQWAMYRDRQYDISRKLIQYLLTAGIDYFCISPGSRSTPLTLSLAKEPKTNKAIFYDERAAAYHAVGYARACGKPAVLICTSGTAPANYFPAVMEANNDSLTLIVISADRPFELYNTGANQTVNQQNLYGEHAAAFANIQASESSAEDEYKSATEAIDIALKDSKPVQINIMYKKPLEPSEEYSFNSILDVKLNKIKYQSKEVEIKADLLIIGELNYPESIYIRKVLSDSNIPFYADIRSGLRNLALSNNINLENLLATTPDILNSKIVHIGGKLVSKKITEVLMDMPEIDLEVYSFRGHKSEIFLRASSINNISILDNISIINRSNIDITNFTDIEINTKYSFEDKDICRYIYANSPKGSIIFSGNSMSVRNFDTHAGKSGKSIYFAANRGVSGIDGNISSAIGLAAGLKGRAERLICVVGDLTAIHDLNSLSTLKYAGMPVTIVIINNHGGSIFSKLPISKYIEEFPYWETPHNYNFKGAADMFGLEYFTVSNLHSFKDVFRYKNSKHSLLEILL